MTWWKMATMIKFRGILKSGFNTDEADFDGTFVYGHYVSAFPEYDYIMGNIIDDGEDFICPEWWVPVDPKTVGQFIGMKDVKGNDIYEGDIVKMQRPGFHERSCYSVKYFIENVCIFQIVKVTDGSTLFEALSNGHDAEVIGNIHENLELLE